MSAVASQMSARSVRPSPVAATKPATRVVSRPANRTTALRQRVNVPGAKRADRLVVRSAGAVDMASTPESSGSKVGNARIGLIGLAVMGQNFALNVAEKGFPISVYNRSSQKTDDAVARADKEGLGDKLT